MTTPENESQLAVLSMAETGIANITAMESIMKTVDAYKKSLMTEGKDYIVQNKGQSNERQYTTRSGFSKLALGFNLSDEVIEEIEIRDPETHEFQGWRFKVRVWHPKSGRSATGVGAATVDEPNIARKKERPYHDCYATAHTRALNRAISNIIGSSEVSAEELGSTVDSQGRRVIDSDYTVEEPVFTQADQFIPEQLTIPNWKFAEGLAESNDVKLTVETWLTDSGIIAPKNAFEYGEDKIKIFVKPKSDVSGKRQEALDAVMSAAGFKRQKNSNLYRLNKEELQ